jgi:hypothetical protein
MTQSEYVRLVGDYEAAVHAYANAVHSGARPSPFSPILVDSQISPQPPIKGPLTKWYGESPIDATAYRH